MHHGTFSLASFCKPVFWLPLFILSVCVLPTTAQVFAPGPSDPSLFDTVINLPPSPDIGNFESIGGDGLTTRLNIADGGSVENVFSALNGSEVNISGGTLGSFSAFDGSEVNFSGGTVGSFIAFDGSEVNISGGTVGSFSAFGGSEVNLFGSNFLLDGTLLDNLLAGQPFTILDRDVTLSGSLADGTAFSFDLNSSFVGGDRFDNAATLTVTSTSATSIPEPTSIAILSLGCTLLLRRRRFR